MRKKRRSDRESKAQQIIGAKAEIAAFIMRDVVLIALFSASLNSIVRRFRNFKTTVGYAKMNKRSALSLSAAQTETCVTNRKDAPNKSLDARRLTHFHRARHALIDEHSRPRQLNRSTASLKIVKFAFYTIFGTLLLILNVSSIAAQEIKNLPFRELSEFVDARPKYCYFDGHTLQDITTYAPADEIILVVARLGERDSRQNLNKRRLHNVFTLWTQQYKRDQKTIVLADAQGAPVKGFGQLEFYVRGRLIDVIKLYGDLRAHDCYAGIDDTPPCGEDWQKLYYPCKDQVIKAKPKRKVVVKKWEAGR